MNTLEKAFWNGFAKAAGENELMQQYARQQNDADPATQEAKADRYGMSPELLQLLTHGANSQAPEVLGGEYTPQSATPPYRTIPGVGTIPGPSFAVPSYNTPVTQPMQFNSPADVRSSSAEGSPGGSPAAYRDTNTQLPLTAPSNRLGSKSLNPVAPPRTNPNPAASGVINKSPSSGVTPQANPTRGKLPTI